MSAGIDGLLPRGMEREIKRAARRTSALPPVSRLSRYRFLMISRNSPSSVNAPAA